MALRNDYLIDQVQPADEIEVWWPADKQYYPGVVDQVLTNGRYHITYLDGEEEVLRLSNERWRFRGKAADRVARGHANAVGNRKRTRKFFPTHEPEPIVIDDDDDQPPPKRARHKPRTHHSNSVIALDGTPSLSTQQSDIEIEEVPVQVHPPPVSDHRASDVSDPIVSDIEHEVIEEEILDRGYGGDTASAADTSELRYHDARENRSTPQTASTHKTAKSNRTAKSTPPGTSANSLKEHRNSFTAQSASLSAQINSTSPNNAQFTLENRAALIISPAPLASHAHSNPDKSAKRSTQFPSLKLPASAVKRHIPSASKPSTKASSALPANAARNISSRTASDKSPLSSQQRPALNSAKGITASISTKPNLPKKASHGAALNPAPHKKRATNFPASSPTIRTPKAIGHTGLREHSMSKEKKTTTIDDQSERKKGTATDIPKIKSVALTTGNTQLTQPGIPQSAAVQLDPKENATVDPPLISLAPAMKVSAPSDPNPRTPQRISGTDLGASRSPIRTLQRLEGKETTRKQTKPVSSPTRNPKLFVGPKSSTLIRKQPSLPLKSAAPEKDTQKQGVGSIKGDSRSRAQEAKPQLPAGPQTKAQTCKKPTPTSVRSQESLAKQGMSYTKSKEVASFTQTTTPPKQRTALADDNRQTPSAAAAGPHRSKSTEENNCCERPKAKTSDGASPDLRSRVSLPKSALPEVAKTADLGNSRSEVEHAAMFAANTSYTSKQIAEPRTDKMTAGSQLPSKQLPSSSATLRKKSRHPSEKVVSSERIPRNKPLSAPSASKSLLMDLSRNQSQAYKHSGVLLPSSSAPGQRFGTTSPMKPMLRISSPTPLCARPGSMSNARDISTSRSLGTTTVATQEGNMHLRKSGTDMNDREREAQIPRPPMLKAHGSISIQSLVSSPRNVARSHAMSSTTEQNPTPLVSFQDHNVESARLSVTTNAVGASSITRPNSAATPRLYPAPSVPHIAAVSGAAAMPRGSNAGQTQNTPQTSSAPLTATNQRTPNLPDIGIKQVRTIAVGTSPSVNAVLLGKLPPLKTPPPAHAERQRGEKNGRKRSAGGNDRPEEAAKRKRIVTSAKRSQVLRDVRDAAKLPDGPQVPSEATVTTSRMKDSDHTNGDGSAALRRASLPKAPLMKEKPALVAGATTFASPGNQTQATAPLNFGTANAQTSLQAQVSTTSKVLDPFTNLGSQPISGVSVIKSSVNVSKGLSLATTASSPCDALGATSLRTRVISAQGPMHFRSATRTSNVSEFMRVSEDMDSLLISVLKTMDEKFSILSKKSREDFESLKKHIKTVSGDLSLLGSRVDHVDEFCRSDKLLERLEQSLDKRHKAVNQQIEKETRESLQVARRRLLSSYQEVTQKITRVTSTLVQDAIQDVKKVVEQEYRHQSELMQSSGKNLPPSVGSESVTIARGDGGETANKSSESQSWSNKSVLQNNSIKIPEENLELGRPLGTPEHQRISTPSSAPHNLASKSKPTVVTPQVLSSQFFDAESSNLIARCVVDWLQNGECRKRAPKSEREFPVAHDWVNATTLKCFNSILSRLQSWGSYSEADAAISESLAGKIVETEWLTRSTNDACVERARGVYDGWEPKLFDFEWQTEKKVMLAVARRVNAVQKLISDRNHRFGDPLHRAISCVVAARGTV